MQKINFFDTVVQYQSIQSEIDSGIARVLQDGGFIMGEDVLLFEKEVAVFLNVRHVVSMNSGTDALQIALRAMGVGVGDEVVTTPFSFFATAEAISHVGAIPVFVDIDETTFNIDSSLLEVAITSKTKAIIPVHLYGRPCEMTAILEIANRFGIPVLEDCAQCFGATAKNASGVPEYTGTMGLAGAFSFFPTKNLGAYGDGGMLVTNDDAIAEKARMLRVHGAKKKYHNEMIGYNSRLDTIQAAVLRVKLRHIKHWNELRVAVARRYQELLEGVEGIVLPDICEGHVFHQYTIRILGGKRDLVKVRLEEVGIPTMIYYPIPQDELPVYAGQYVAQKLSQQLTTEILSLPMYPEIPDNVQVQVVDALKKILSDIG
jgi:dTDP-4-amino-4,6-dideoxygalactose transaminase